MNKKQIIDNLRKHGVTAFQRYAQDCITVVHQTLEGAQLAELDIERDNWLLSAEDGRELFYNTSAFKDGDHKYMLNALNEHYYYGND